MLGRDFGSLPPGLVLSLAAQTAEPSGRALASASTNGLWDGQPLPAPRDVGKPGIGQCLLTGSWTNDLESTMEINVDKTGMFSGLYRTKVSSSGKSIPPSPLQGIQHQGHQPTFGFTVSWDVTGSTTVFVGQCLVDKNGQEQLKTIWLLRSKVEFASDDWNATRVGTNIFMRTK
ncbi:avidin-like [Vipera latastei]